MSQRVEGSRETSTGLYPTAGAAGGSAVLDLLSWGLSSVEEAAVAVAGLLSEAADGVVVVVGGAAGAVLLGAGAAGEGCGAGAGDAAAAEDFG